MNLKYELTKVDTNWYNLEVLVPFEGWVFIAQFTRYTLAKKCMAHFKKEKTIEKMFRLGVNKDVR